MNDLHKAILKIACILCFAFCISQSNSRLHAQPFKQEILQFQKSDSIVMPPKGQIVFAGSSSFTKWKDVAMYFPGYPIINRGFGGASLLDSNGNVHPVSIYPTIQKTLQKFIQTRFHRLRCFQLSTSLRLLLFE